MELQIAKRSIGKPPLRENRKDPGTDGYYDMKMLALLFQERKAAEMWDAWGMEAYRLNGEYKTSSAVSVLRAQSYALLARPELYGKGKTEFVPFRQGELFSDVIHRGFSTIRRRVSARKRGVRTHRVRAPLLIRRWSR